MEKNFSKLKAKTRKNKKSNVIYQILCNNCEGIYIGQTSQYLENRLKGHWYDKNNKTALINHEKLKRHIFNFDETKILKTESHPQKKREFLGMIEIHKNKNVIKKLMNDLNGMYFSYYSCSKGNKKTLDIECFSAEVYFQNFQEFKSKALSITFLMKVLKNKLG